MTAALPEYLRGGLIASCQPVDGGAMDDASIVAAMARAAVDGGARGLRIEGLANLRAARARTDAPIVGILKRDLPDSPVRITPFLSDVTDLIAAGADIIAVDATARPRPQPVAELLQTIHDGGALAMADCSSLEEARTAADMGFDLIASTLSGYTGGPVPEAPDLALVREMARLGPMVVAEGRYNTPQAAAEALRAGAGCVTVGSALTRLEVVTGWFADALNGVAP